MKLLTVSARTVFVLRWFNSTNVLTKNECFNCSVIQFSTIQPPLLYDICLSKMFLFHKCQKFSVLLGAFVQMALETRWKV